MNPPMTNSGYPSHSNMQYNSSGYYPPHNYAPQYYNMPPARYPPNYSHQPPMMGPPSHMNRGMPPNQPGMYHHQGMPMGMYPNQPPPYSGNTLNQIE